MDSLGLPIQARLQVVQGHLVPGLSAAVAGTPSLHSVVRQMDELERRKPEERSVLSVVSTLSARMRVITLRSHALASHRRWERIAGAKIRIQTRGGGDQTAPWFNKRESICASHEG